METLIDNVVRRPKAGVNTCPGGQRQQVGVAILCLIALERRQQKYQLCGIDRLHHVIGKAGFDAALPVLCLPVTGDGN
jgi:hypothetical protein